MRLSLLRSWNWVTGLVWLIVQFGKQQLDKTSNYCLMWRGQEHPDPWEMTYTSMDKPDLIHTVQTYSVWHHNYYVLLLVTWPSCGSAETLYRSRIKECCTVCSTCPDFQERQQNNEKPRTLISSPRLNSDFLCDFLHRSVKPCSSRRCVTLSRLLFNKYWWINK